MNKNILLTSKVCLTLISFTMVFCCHIVAAKVKVDKAQELSHQIDAYLSTVMLTHEIPGMGVAIIQNNQVIYKSYFGNADMNDVLTPINENTVFRLYSLSKLITTVSVFKLIETGALSLDDELSDFFENLPPAWESIAIKHLLSHTSGLPDVHQLSSQLADESISDEAFIKLLYTKEMDFKTGEEWRYNQTNFLLLKLIIEQASHMKFEEFVTKSQFAQVKPSNVYFLADPSMNLPNRAHYYSFNQQNQVYETKNEHRGTRNHPLSGLNITLDEFITWNNKLDTNQLISAPSKASMWTAAEIKNSDRKFLHGWDVYALNQQESFGFSGGGVSGFRKFVGNNLSIIVLTTGYKYYSMQDTIIDHLAGLVDHTLLDEASVLTESIMDQFFLSNNHTDILSTVLQVKKTHPTVALEKIFKSIGYRLFFDLGQKEQAITLNQFNVLLYPTSFDTYGTLGYLYFLTEQYQLSKFYYSKALELNPKNHYSATKLQQIENMFTEGKTE